MSNGTLAVVAGASLGSTSVAVAGGTLALQTATAVSDAAALSVADGGTVLLGGGATETVDKLFINGAQQPRGYYGTTASGATFADDVHFEGAGLLYVMNNPPITPTSVTWDAGGTDLRLSTPANWVGDETPAFDGTNRVTFATGGLTASVDVAANLYGITFNRAGAFTLAAGAGAISDGFLPCTITKTGFGPLGLTGSSTFDGTLTINEGDVNIYHSQALGSTNGNTVINGGTGGRLVLNGNLTLSEPLVLNGEKNNGGTLIVGTGSNVITGPLTCINQVRIQGLNGPLVIAGGVTADNNGLFVVNAGSTLTFKDKPLNLGTRTFWSDSPGISVLAVSGNNWADTICAGGGIRCQVANAMPATAALGLGISFYGPGGTFNLNGHDQTVRIVDGGAKLNLADGVNERVSYLILGNTFKRAGTYGSSSSVAMYTDNAHFSGSGLLTVLHDAQGTALLLAPSINTNNWPTPFVTNTVPFVAGFEDHPAGVPVSGTSGWRVEDGDASRVINQLYDYTGTRPLDTTHTNVLQLETEGQTLGTLLETNGTWFCLTRHEANLLPSLGFLGMGMVDDLVVTPDQVFETVLYGLTVNTGTGSGAYTNGQQVAVAANPPVTGCLFDRWTGATQHVASVTSANTTVTMPALDITLLATYTAGTYTVTFNPQDGTTPSPASKTVTYGLAYGALAATTRSGFSFGGWYSDAACMGTEVTNASLVTITNDHTLYAKWILQTTTTTPVQVPFLWLDQFPDIVERAGGNYEIAAFNDPDLDGMATWQEYVAGSNPTNGESFFRSLITVSDDRPWVTWTPDLGTARVYSVFGKTNLTDTSWGITNAGNRFFKVKVNTPQL